MFTVSQNEITFSQIKFTDSQNEITVSHLSSSHTFPFHEKNNYAISRFFYENILQVYDHFYNGFLLFFPDCILVFSDTDSICILVKTDNLEESLKRLQERFQILDFSNYEVDHPLYSAQTKNMLGRWKHETPGTSIRKIIALKSKCYSFLTVPYKGSKENVVTACKGIKKSSVPHFEAYERALFGNTTEYATYSKIEAKNFQLRTVRQHKRALNNLETKRW